MSETGASDPQRVTINFLGKNGYNGYNVPWGFEQQRFLINVISATVYLLRRIANVSTPPRITHVWLGLLLSRRRRRQIHGMNGDYIE